MDQVLKDETTVAENELQEAPNGFMVILVQKVTDLQTFGEAVLLEVIVSRVPPRRVLTS